jgi:hypothetical protein
MVLKIHAILEGTHMVHCIDTYCTSANAILIIDYICYTSIMLSIYEQY